VVGTVANFTPKKDHAGLLAAIDQLRGRFGDVVLLLVGSGPLETELRAQVAERGLEAHVRFVGPRGDVPALLPALDVFVLGSRFEGLPISLLEAMAAEVACVATNVGGIPEVVTDRIDGRLVPPGQPQILARIIAEVLMDQELRTRMAVAGRQRVADEFSIDRAVRRTEELYGQLVGAPLARR
jgi:glycosyltransferase involved in cell wall biosynthesis